MTSPSRRSVVIGLTLAVVGFGYGAVVGARHVFPYDLLVAVWSRSSASSTDTRTGEREIETSLLLLRSTTYPGIEGEPNPRPGGGLTTVRGNVLGVDRWGSFFVYAGEGAVRMLDLRVATNVEELRRETVTEAELREEELDPDALIAIGLDVDDPSTYNLRSFRFLDVAADETDDSVTVYVTYYHWYPEERCKALRVARLPEADPEAFLPGRLTARSGPWEVIFESSPCLELSYRNNSPFQSPNSGGRLLPLEGRLLVTVGDHHMDGASHPVIAPQRDDHDYGKVIAIDLQTLSTSTFAEGLRNPQGLAIDAQGRLWETEHGPRGGDELNLLEEGGDYGWPIVTFGTQYGQLTWPANPRQGRHEGYALPVYAWAPSIGVSNLIQIDGFHEAWDGDLLVASLEANSLFRLRIVGERVVMSEPIHMGERIRDLEQMGDGRLILWTDSHRLVEIVPESASRE